MNINIQRILNKRAQKFLFNIVVWAQYRQETFPE